MTYVSPQPVLAFRRAVEAGDADAVLATFADDITFHSPVLFHPLQGLDVMRVLVPRLLIAWQNLRYTGELHGPEEIGLTFTAGIGNRIAQGIDLLHIDSDHRIDHITVMVRPLTALTTLASEMAGALPSAARE